MQPCQINAETLAKRIRKAARLAGTEEDLKMKVEPLLQDAFARIGLDVELVRYEKPTSTGLRAKRMDVVYGYLHIEYKRPGTLCKSVELRKAVMQVDGYLRSESARLGGGDRASEKLVGVILDGEEISYHRYSIRGQRFTPPVALPETHELFPDLRDEENIESIGPFPVNEASIANLLIFARATNRRPLTAEDLAEVFGPRGALAKGAISDLYTALTRGQIRSRPRVRTFFGEWESIFGIVYGESLERAESRAREVAEQYELPSGVRLKNLLFTIHTYYALVMKLIVIELLSLQEDSATRSIVSDLAAADDASVRNRLAAIESGEGFRERGIDNFLEGDFLSWYLDGWARATANMVRSLARALSQFEPATPLLQPEWTRDLLQRLYEELVPRELRHDLGEYYTPRWLAGHLIDRCGFAGKPGQRFLDPACGSGTFLVLAIERALAASAAKGAAQLKGLGERIQSDIVGFDINPVAVLAARTNYFLKMAPLLRHLRPLHLPIYMCDAVLTPSRIPQPGEVDPKDTIPFTTTKGTYHFPVSVTDRESIRAFSEHVETGVRSGLSREKFRNLMCKQLGVSEDVAGRLAEIYRQIKTLAENDENGIWARYIKNGFAPIYSKPFGFVVGNPPWIRWGYLARDYREATLHLWRRYGLFSLKGHEARLGAGEKDFSTLFTYACADFYLAEGGTLGFVITLEAFKSKGAGEGFRRFELPHLKIPLRVLFLEDMVHLQPFASATNKTSIFAMRKGKRASPSVPFVEWRRKKGVGRIDPKAELKEVMESTVRAKGVATPVDAARPESSWQTGSRSAIRSTVQLKGRCDYKARRGAATDPYGVFWLTIDEARPDKRIVVQNMHDRGKRKVASVRTALEPDLLFPAVSGGEITPFGIKSHFCVLISQDPATREPYPEAWMLDRCPLTYAYLKQFEKLLLSRGSKIVAEFAKRTAFYAMYGIGPYTFAPFRVVWKRMASRMEAVVLSKIKTDYGMKPIVATDTTALIATEERDEAHFLCSVLNSEPVDSFVRSFSSAGRGFGAPAILKNIAIPKFDRKKALHGELATLSIQAHDLVREGKDMAGTKEKIDEAARKLWNIKR